ncbi:hypothetical protein SRHO_G00027020 [Serrasalmus rhombeus]
MHGDGNLKFCGCFSKRGPGNLNRIYDIKDLIKYKEILDLSGSSKTRRLVNFVVASGTNKNGGALTEGLRSSLCQFVWANAAL